MLLIKVIMMINKAKIVTSTTKHCSDKKDIAVGKTIRI